MVAPAMDFRQKEKRNGLRMKRQNPAPSVSRSFLSSDFPSVTCFRCRMPFQACGRQGQDFRAEYAPQEEDSARNGTAARPCRCHQTMRYLCIRASGTSGWRNESQLYHRLLPLPQETNNVIGVSFLVAQILFITNRLNKIHSLLHILNAMAIIISRL